MGKIISIIFFFLLISNVLVVSAEDVDTENSGELKVSWFGKFLSFFGIGSYAKFRLALSKEDPSYCISISSNFWQGECLDETIQFNKDPALCDKIDEDNIEANRARDECYIGVAIMENDISYCDFVGNDEEMCEEIAEYYVKTEGIDKEKEFNECVSLINNTKNRCKVKFASGTKDISVCSELLDIPKSLYDGNWGIYDNENCEDSVAMKIKDISLCRTSGCIIDIVKGTQNYEDCSRILDSEITISRWASGERIKDVQYDFCLVRSENSEACFSIRGESTSCFWGAADRTNNASWCGLIAPHDPKDFGTEVCTGAPDDPLRTCEYTEGYLNRNDLLRVQCYAQINQCEKAIEISQRLKNHCYHLLGSYGSDNEEKEEACSNIIIEGKPNPSCNDYVEYMQGFSSGSSLQVVSLYT